MIVRPAWRGYCASAIAALAIACGPKHAAPAPQAAGERAALSAENAPDRLSATCFRRGPLACDVPPSRAGARAAIDACWPDPALGYQAQATRERATTSVAELAAPSELGAMRRALVVQASLVNAKNPQFQGFYLLAEYAEGFCLIDELVSPGDAQLARCEHTFGLAWLARQKARILEVSHAATCSAERGPPSESKGSKTFGVDHDRFDLYWDLPREPDSAATAPAGTFSCHRRGPWSCEQSPAGEDPVSLCKHITACARNHHTNLGAIFKVTDCEPLASVTPGPAGSDMAAVAMVSGSVRFEQEDETYFHASYMLAKYEGQGWCLIDQVFEPLRVPQFCETATQVRFAPSGQAQGVQLDLRSQRVAHEAVDEDEAEGYSGVYAEECQDSQYLLRDGIFRKQRVAARDGRCDAEAKQGKVP